MKEISDVAHEYIVECENIAFDAHSRVCKLLMLDGANNFYSSNGSPISHARVLEEHHTMQVALGRIHGKLDVACDTQIEQETKEREALLREREK